MLRPVPAPHPKVLQVAQPQDGGVAEHVLALTLGLVERGWPVEVATPPGSVIAPHLAEAGVPVHEVPMTRAPGPSDLGAARALRALDARERYGVVHAHSSKAGALVRSALPRGGRLAYTPHCFAFATPGFGRGRRLMYTAIEQAFVPRSGVIVGVCEWEREQARARLRGAAGRMEVVRNGVGPCPQAEPHPELREWSAGLPLAGLVAVLRPQKDPLTLVRAAARLDPARARLAIVGNGELAEAIEREIDALGVGDRIRLFPFEGDVAPYLHALDVFVLPSGWEALPIAVLEAMACGVPVVATRVGGVPEAVDEGRTGELIPPGDPQALAEALKSLLPDRARLDSYGAEARRVATERFAVDGMVDAVAQLYERLLR